MIDATLATFEREVLDASREVPVLVDFWAPWCGPCRTLGPLLEKLEAEYAGRWRLVKVDSDANPELSAQFQVRSIPYVVAFSAGKPVAQFVGAQTEGQLRAFLDRLIPTPATIALREAREAMAREQYEIAGELLEKALALDPSSDAARLDLARVALERGDVAGARAQFDALSGNAEQQSTHASVRARLEAAEHAGALPPAEELRRRIAADASDLQARLDLAESHIARREFEGALEQLLEIVKRDRKFGEDIGRVKMLAVFEMAASDPDLVSDYRRRLSGALY